jgi:glycerol-3-phosphate acyltransferase PlsY
MTMIADAFSFATTAAVTTELILAFALGYLLGSIPFGLILARAAGAGDVRKFGSGNIGATNVFRAAGKALGAATLVLDALKATAAILLARALFDTPGTFAAAGALIGHLYPVWLGFRGGKGVATLLGILIALMPIAAAIFAAVWIVTFLVTRYSSVAGMIASLSAPVAAALLGERLLFPMLVGFALLVIWKHRTNLVRLKAGTEVRIGRGG